MRTAALVLTLLVTGCAASPAPEPGPCVIKPTAEAMACTQQYDPVCGCDGRTYPNACMARIAGVQRSRPGTCDEPPRGEPGT